MLRFILKKKKPTHVRNKTDDSISITTRHPIKHTQYKTPDTKTYATHATPRNLNKKTDPIQIAISFITYTNSKYNIVNLTSHYLQSRKIHKTTYLTSDATQTTIHFIKRQRQLISNHCNGLE